ncbi:ATP-binding domain-containing protein, partial [bacterium]|nr:ATP-binding domain-containing protein [bacterium]
MSGKKSDKEVQIVSLSGKLEEFRIALEDEIKSAKINAYGQAISLVSGRKISQIGKSYQYVFRLENALNLPVDAPGDLHIPNRKPAEVIIISVDGLSIILSSREDLSDYVPQGRLVSDLTFLMRKLIERIEELADTENKVGDRILNNSYAFGKFESRIYPTNANGETPNKKQQEALQSSLDNDLTYIWGPPGTGKTRTIGSIGHQLQCNQRSLLIVSHTNAAVDQALINIAQQTDDELIDQGKVLRVGIPKDKRLSDDFPNTLLETHVERRSKELSDRLKSLRDELATFKIEAQKLTKDIELYDWFFEARSDLKKMRSDNDDLVKMELELGKQRNRYVELKERSSFWVEAKAEAIDTGTKIVHVTQLDSKIIETSSELAKCSSNQEQIAANLLKAKRILDETKSANWITRGWRRLPSPDQQEKIVDDIERQSKKTEKHHHLISSELTLLKTNRERLKKEISGFREKYSGDPDEILSQEIAYQQEFKQLVAVGIALKNKCHRHRTKTTRLFRVRLNILQELGHGESEYGTAEDMFSQIDQAFEKIAGQIERINIEQCRSKAEEVIRQIEKIEIEIFRVDELLSRIEETVIAEADIVATTLTRVYLRDSIRNRRFDTIIIDEASMAPIPAIWVASSLIENSGVIVGDPKQLPPIVVSSHKMAEKWLGKDVFSVSGVMDTKPRNLIQLNEQYRMHPEITAIPNQFFYKGDDKLINAGELISIDSIGDWYNTNWEYDNPVILVDTGPLNAWVTSVPRGKSSSRLNFLSAILCVNLCKTLLKDGRPDQESNDAHRIIIQSPYKPHVKLLGLLLQDFNLKNDVVAGTVHTFQGSEADVVIFDLVNDEPHWRVGLFIPEYDENTKRLFNVSITRAKQRLIVIGDFSYYEKQSKRAFLGRDFIPFLKEKYPVYSAAEMIPLDILDQVAGARNLISEGKFDKDITHLVVTQDDFYPFLLEDFNFARSRIVIYSPFITENRLAELQPALFSTISRGIQIYVVTKTLQERGKRAIEQYRYIERSLDKWGVIVVHKRNMHEKLVVIDDNILWSGS